MTEIYRSPAGERLAVLRPEDAKRSLSRLAEWNAILDGAADDAHAQERAKREADALWLVMLREQGWRFVGWLLEDLKLTTGGPAAPGDLHMDEKRFEKEFGP